MLEIPRLPQPWNLWPLLQSPAMLLRTLGLRVELQPWTLEDARSAIAQSWQDVRSNDSSVGDRGQVLDSFLRNVFSPLVP